MSQEHTFQEAAAVGGTTVAALRYHFHKGLPKRDARTGAIYPARGLALCVRRTPRGLRIDADAFERWLEGRPIAEEAEFKLKMTLASTTPA